MKKLWITLCLSSLIFALPALADNAKKKAPAKQAATQEEPAHKSNQGLAAGGQGYGMAGCGLGSIVFGESKGMIQIVAATLNGIEGNQTFAITSGTSNCAPSNGGTAAHFIDANREALAKDMSRGSGESLDALSELMGCKDKALFGQKLQAHYGEIFPSEKASTESVTSSIENTVKGDEQLSKSCG